MAGPGAYHRKGGPRVIASVEETGVMKDAIAFGVSSVPLPDAAIPGLPAMGPA